MERPIRGRGSSRLFLTLATTLLFFALTNRAGRAAGSGTTPSAAETKAARKTIQAAYDAINAAVFKKDVEAVMGFYTKNYVHVSRDGERHTVAEMRELLKEAMKAIKSGKTRSEILKFSLQGGVAKVHLRDTTTLVMTPPGSGDPALYESKSHLVDTWSRQNGRWLLRHTKEVTDLVKINGERIKR